MSDLPFACRCGAVRGSLRGLSPGIGTHLVCYCADCRAYARHLGEESLLDPAGGTELFQTAAARLELTAGQERLACLRMTRRGPVRWYTTCCGSAIANTPPTAAVPFAGFYVARLPADPQALGPLLAQVFTDSAERADGRLPRKFGLRTVFFRFVRTTMAARLSGEHRRNPFFPGGKPLALARTLTAQERRAAYT